MTDIIKSKYQEWATAQVQPPYRSGHTHASTIGHPCVRHHVFNRLCGEQRPAMSPHLAVLLREGKLHEEDVRRRLSEIGFPVLRSETPWYDDELGLSGRPDGFIEIERKTYCVEIKALGPMYDRINSVADFSDGPVFARKYPSQLECYMRAFPMVEAGLWVIKSKATGEFKFIEQPRSLELWTAIAGKCRAIQLWSADLKGSDLLTAPEESLPPTCDEPEWCADCPWRGLLCHAPIATKGVIVADDSTLEALLARRAELAPGVKEYEELDKAIKEQAKARVDGSGVVLCGNWSLSVRTQNRKSLKPPKGAAIPAEWYQETSFQVTTIKEVSDE